MVFHQPSPTVVNGPAPGPSSLKPPGASAKPLHAATSGIEPSLVTSASPMPIWLGKNTASAAFSCWRMRG